MKERIGVYVCHCGGNISDYVDVEQLRDLMKDEDGVVVSKNVMFACADSGQNEIVNDIIEQKLDAIVVASCSPKLHTHTFRNAATRGGLNKYNYIQVNIREQCSWAHSDKPMDATAKAVGLVRAGIRKAFHSEALESTNITAHKSALVIGAGVAGMRAAIELANMGSKVFLIEKDYFVGGRVAQSGELFVTGQKGKEIVTNLYNKIKSNKNITLFTGSTINKVTGSLGNFNVKINLEPRYIVEGCDEKNLEKAIKDCKKEVPNNFEHGLTKQKAIYKNYEGAHPDKYAVVKEALSDDIDFANKYSDCIDLSQKTETMNLEIGSILVTTGYDSYQPKEDEFGYKTIDNVVTLPEFKTIIENSNSKLIYNKKEIKTIAYIYCVGNRQKKGENKYCSRSCCTSAIHTSLLTRDKFKNINAYHLYRDIRTYGKQELLYEKSSTLGDIYFKFNEKKPPVIEKTGNKTVVKFKDLLTNKTEIELEPDLVVLVTGAVPREDSSDIASVLKIPVGNDKFFNEIHPKLRPVETVINGVFIGGSCQGPKNVTESVKSSLAATAKINALLKKGTIELEPIVAKVNEDACEWCDKCTAVCDYDAIIKIEKDGKSVASINKVVCTGCGICVPVCPKDALEIACFSDNEIMSMIDGFAVETEIKEKEVKKDEKPSKPRKKMGKPPKIWKQISEVLKTEAKTIPEITKEMGIDNDIVTYNIMTMNKYGVIEVTTLDDNDEYYYYKLKQ